MGSRGGVAPMEVHHQLPCNGSSGGMEDSANLLADPVTAQAVVEQLRAGQPILSVDGTPTKLCVAVHVPTGQVFVLKSVSCTALPRELRQLENEQAALGKLRGSRNVVQLLHALETEEEGGGRGKGLLLEFLSGGSLAGVLRRCGVLLPEVVVQRYAGGILRGLRDVHAQGLVHCDVKAANILLSKNMQEVKLCSFGYSMAEGEAKRRLKKKQRLQGTYNWMAPEVMRQENQTWASDVWSFGCTIVELLSGSAPWATHSKLDSLPEVIGYGDQHPPLPDHISPTCREFLLLCLQRDPGLRPTAQQLLRHPFLCL